MNNFYIFCILGLLVFNFDSQAQSIIQDHKKIYPIQNGWEFKVKDKKVVPVKVGLGLVDQDLKPPVTGYYITKVYYNADELTVPQGVYLDRIQDADRVYFNGRLIGKTGIFPPEGEYQPNWFLKRLYYIPSSWILINQPNEIKVEIYYKNASFQGGIFRTIPAIGNYHILEEKIIFQDVVDFALIILFFGIGAYQIFSIVMKRQAKTNFFLLLSSIFYILWRLPLINFFLINFPIPFSYTLSMFFTFQTLFPLGIFLFCYSIFEQEFYWYDSILISIFLLVALFQIFPIAIDTRIVLLQIWEIILIPSIILVGIRISIAIRQQKREAILIALGILILLLSGAIDISIDIFTGKNIYLTQYGFLGMMVLSAVSVSYRNAKNERELSSLTKYLENRVTERTFELQKKQDDLEKDLFFASQLQEGLLPISAPLVHNIQITAKYVPMVQVGGDFYDWIELDENRLILIIIDVSGHGIAAALISTMVKVQFRNFIQESQNPSEILYKINNSLSTLMMKYFVTANCALFDTLNKKASFASAGHPYPIVSKKNSGEAIFLKLKGIILGWKENQNFPLIERPLQSGERFFFYTDGVTEAQNKYELFGEDRLLDLINLESQKNIYDSSEAILESIFQFAGKNLNDDLTFVIVDIV